MAFYAFSAFCVVISGLYVAGELTLPVTTCKRGSDKYSSCLKHSIKEAWPRFIKGLPEFDFPSLDPLSYGSYHAIYDTNEIYGDVTADNVTILGLTNTHFLAARSHLLNDVFRLEVDVLVPLVFSESYVNAQGTLLNLINIAGKGYCNATVEELRVTWDLTGHVVNDTWIVEHFRLAPQIKKMKIYTSGFFDNDPEMNNLIMNLVNQYWPVLLRVMLPVTMKEWDMTLTNITNVLFSKVSFSKVFP